MTGECVSRRSLLHATMGIAFLSVAGCSSPADVGPTSEPPPTVGDHPPYGEWVGEAPAYDRTDQETVTIFNGVQGNGGYYAFEPTAVVVTPGTTIVWRWTGRGGLHNVIAVDRDIQSQLTGEAGHEFRQTVTEPGQLRYYCGPHRSRGMRGVVIVRSA